MKKVSFSVQKWTVRAVVAIGALIGISACCHTKKVVNDDNNYNNNNNYSPPIHNLKYGPLVEIKKTLPVLVSKRVDENGNVVYDTISPSQSPEQPKLKNPVIDE